MKLIVKTKIIIAFVTSVIILCLGICASAAVNVKKTKRLVLPQKVTSYTYAQIVTPEILPSSIAPDESSQSVLTKMADNSISLYWKNSPLRHSAAGKAVETAEKKLNVEAVFQDENKINHRFNFKVMAMQTLAKIQYTGWVNATLNYDLSGSRTIAEVTESLSDRNDLVVSHQVTSTEQQSAVSLKWNW